ncbi:hypothetical protein BD413DRAFT_205824 [Trametes elegans]|nr:hypothetical protein BD413DRAFT_205824 [Trametes elegans]
MPRAVKLKLKLSFGTWISFSQQIAVALSQEHNRSSGFAVSYNACSTWWQTAGPGGSSHAFTPGVISRAHIPSQTSAMTPRSWMKYAREDDGVAGPPVSYCWRWRPAWAWSSVAQEQEQRGSALPDTLCAAHAGGRRWGSF